MRCLLTSDTLGGVWTFTRELTAELLLRGHRVALISFGRLPSASQSAWVKSIYLRYPGSFEYFASASTLEWMQDNQNAYADGIGDLLRLLDRFLPDVVHANQFCFGLLPRSVPVVVTAHSDVYSWARACDSNSLTWTRWLDDYREMVQRGLDNAATVVAPTRWMLEALGGDFLLRTPTHVILNGRTLPVSPAADGPRHLRAVSVGRLWDKGKNLLLLYQAKLPMPVLLAGELEFLEERAPSSRALEFLGCLDENSLLTLFRSSAVYLAPSLYEPFGLAPLEAAQCGCALLLYDLPSFREIWGDAALYFNDAPSLSDALAQLLSSSSLLYSLQQRATKRALQLSASRMTDQYLAVYQSLLVPHESSHHAA
jgi:glycosyltransferase involved in cell wall biosynthesis